MTACLSKVSFLRSFLAILPLFFLSATTPLLRAAGTTPQVIQLQTIPDQTIGVTPFQILAVVPSNLPLVYTVTGPATLDQRLLTLTAPGTVTVHVHQAGNSVYSEADAQESFQVNRATPSIAWNPEPLTYGSPFSSALQTAVASANPVASPAADIATITGAFSTSPITGGTGVTISPTSALLRYEGSNMAPSTAPNDGSGYIATSGAPDAGFDYRVAFTCDCDQLDFKIQSRESAYRVWVDGDWTTDDQIAQVNQYPAFVYYHIDFPDRRLRQIKIGLSGDPPFFGLVLPAGESISAPQVPIGDRYIIIGDSWTGPTISPNLFPPAQPGTGGSGYPQWLSQYFNWDFEDSPDGGEGFSNGGTTHTDFAQRMVVENVCAQNPKGFVILGGVNDSNNYPGVYAGAMSLFTELTSCLPQGPIYVIGPQNLLTETAQGISDAAALFPGIVFYEDMEADNWFYGDTYDQTTGNNWDYTGVSTNGTLAHPTPDGHDFLADRIAWFIQSVVPSARPSTYFLSSPVTAVGTYAYSASGATLLPAGAQTIAVTFTPQDSVNYASSTQNFTITVNKATTSTSLIVPAQATAGVGTTLAAMVNPQIGGTPTGQVVFSANGQSIGSASLVNGQATLTGADLASGSQVLTAAYAGDSNFLASSSAPATVPVAIAPDFAVQAGVATVTVQPGGSASVPITVTPAGGLQAALNLTCTSLPATVTCSLAGTATQLQVTQQQPVVASVTFQAAATQTTQSERSGGLIERVFLCGCLPFSLLALIRRRRCAFGTAMLFLAGSVLVSTMGCGTTAHSPGSPPVSSPSATYTVQLVLTNSAVPSMAHSAQIMVVVP